MDRLCSTIFLILVIGALVRNALQDDQLNVHLEPNNIQVCEGESVTMNCTFQPGGKYKVKLYYSQTPNSDCKSATEKLRIRKQINDTWSTFNITSIKTNDSGWYFCKVTREIPVLLENCSNGVRVRVDANRTHEYTNQIDNQTQNPTTEDSPTTCYSNTFLLEPETLNVHLVPKYIQVCEGESVAMNCTFQPGEKCRKYKVKLYYSQTPDSDCKSATEKLRISKQNKDTWSTFNITSIETNDSGWYFCKVTRDIPVLLEKCSNGIQVLVNSTCMIKACV